MNIVNFSFKAIIVSTFFLFNHTHIKASNLEEIEAIVFDLNGVVVETNIIESFKFIGAMNFFYFSLETFLLLDSKYFLDALNEVPSEIEKKSYHNNKQMPPIMIEWLIGHSNNKEILERTKKAINSSLRGRSEKIILNKLSKLTFNPSIFGKNFQLKKDTAQLIKRIKEKTKIKIFALSNWDKESISFLKEKFGNIFSLFDGFVISGEEKHLKPEKEIFEVLINRFNLKKDKILFYDDEIKNVESAENFGIQSFVFGDKTISTINKLIFE
ncbi:MAG: hypothetical protein CMP11_09310 [Zetaproteobacteria bacterium]|mgnify:CR=1 FL=1|nr:hypothetical protein [Pseudobdellovibrionaceae bacterium]